VLVRCLYCQRLFLTAKETDPCGVCGFFDVVVIERFDRV
jgi:rRNA maturation endonuclease Nob1